jgi:hypothetical protein
VEVVPGPLSDELRDANRWGGEAAVVEALIDFHDRTMSGAGGLETTWLKQMPEGLRLGMKSSHPILGPDGFYGFWYRMRPVLELGTHGFFYLRCGNMRDRMRLEQGSRKTLRDVYVAMRSRQRPILGVGDYCTDSGEPLPAALVPHAVRAFEAVRQGQQLLGCGELVAHGSAGPSGLGSGVPHDRPATQNFLMKMKPSQTLNGNLSGSGNRYVAFRFGHLVIVEFDADAHATYLFGMSDFEELRQWSRGDLIAAKPKGFFGRIVHRDDLEDWKEKILEAIAGHT